MEIQFDNVPVSLDAMSAGGCMLVKEVAKACGISVKQAESARVVRRSVDARKKSNVHFACSIVVDVDVEAGALCPQSNAQDSDRQSSESDIANQLHSPNMKPFSNMRKGVSAKAFSPASPLLVPDLSAITSASGGTNADTSDYATPNATDDAIAGASVVSYANASGGASSSEFKRPIVVGAGPAGLFCALYLAKAGLQPVILERGKPVEERAVDVDTFANGGPLDINSNVQFGEGGAGTFSDGKLNTGIKSPHIRHVLETFVETGAPEDILIDAKPHIGTDLLPGVVRNIRKRIEALGGEFLFNTQLVGIDPVEVRNVETGETHTLETGALVLAIGYSARDTFAMLREAGVAMERKQFAAGVRIEHLQADIDRAQYGKAAGHEALGAADYKLAVHNEDGRGVYTFCMCPGGTVVAASSEEGALCVNGMSVHARDGVNSNSALLVEVKPEDLPGDDVFAGIELQREMERSAYVLGMRNGGIPYTAPVQTVGSFLEGTDSCPSSKVIPSYPRGVCWTDLHGCLPEFISMAIAEALPSLDRRLHGFADPEAVMTGVEPRSSCPVRILRDHGTMQSVSTPGLYPTGEGAGYAGGIMSAAVDGLRVAEAVCKALSVNKALQVLKDGAPLIFPTDTVVGIGVSVEHSDGTGLVGKLKRRDTDKPVAWLVGSKDDISRYADDAPPYVAKLVNRFWPGALTVVVNASDNVPRQFASNGTIGLRMPASDGVLGLIASLGCPIATSSANYAGENPPASIGELDMGFAGATPVFDAGGPSAEARGFASAIDAGVPSAEAHGSASTVIDCTGSAPILIREGTIPFPEILKAIEEA